MNAVYITGVAQPVELRPYQHVGCFVDDCNRDLKEGAKQYGPKATASISEFGDNKLKPAIKDGFDIGDDDKKNLLEDFITEFEPLTKLMKEVVGDNTEKVVVSSIYRWKWLRP